jgi:hypothetical protein
MEQIGQPDLMTGGPNHTLLCGGSDDGKTCLFVNILLQTGLLSENAPVGHIGLFSDKTAAGYEDKDFYLLSRIKRVDKIRGYTAVTKETLNAFVKRVKADRKNGKVSPALSHILFIDDKSGTMKAKNTNGWEGKETLATWVTDQATHLKHDNIILIFASHFINDKEGLPKACMRQFKCFFVFKSMWHQQDNFKTELNCDKKFNIGSILTLLSKFAEYGDMVADERASEIFKSFPDNLVHRFFFVNKTKAEFYANLCAKIDSNTSGMTAEEVNPIKIMGHLPGEDLERWLEASPFEVVPAGSSEAAFVFPPRKTKAPKKSLKEMMGAFCDSTVLSPRSLLTRFADGRSTANEGKATAGEETMLAGGKGFVAALRSGSTAKEGNPPPAVREKCNDEIDRLLRLWSDRLSVDVPKWLKSAIEERLAQIDLHEKNLFNSMISLEASHSIDWDNFTPDAVSLEVWRAIVATMRAIQLPAPAPASAPAPALVAIGASIDGPIYGLAPPPAPGTTPKRRVDDEPPNASDKNSRPRPASSDASLAAQQIASLKQQNQRLICSADRVAEEREKIEQRLLEKDTEIARIRNDAQATAQAKDTKIEQLQTETRQGQVKIAQLETEKVAMIAQLAQKDKEIEELNDAIVEHWLLLAEAVKAHGPDSEEHQRLVKEIKKHIPDKSLVPDIFPTSDDEKAHYEEWSEHPPTTDSGDSGDSGDSDKGDEGSAGASCHSLAIVHSHSPLQVSRRRRGRCGCGGGRRQQQRSGEGPPQRRGVPPRLPRQRRPSLPRARASGGQPLPVPGEAAEARAEEGILLSRTREQGVQVGATDGPLPRRNPLPRGGDAALDDHDRRQDPHRL